MTFPYIDRRIADWDTGMRHARAHVAQLINGWYPKPVNWSLVVRGGTISLSPRPREEKPCS